jgi:hypothetical protein
MWSVGGKNFITLPGRYLGSGKAKIEDNTGVIISLSGEDRQVAHTGTLLIN